MSGKIQVGDIVLIPFPFSDLSNNKVRPSIVLALDRDDMVIVFITTVKPKSEFIEIKQDRLNNLKINSYIRYTKIATIDQTLSLGKIGVLGKEDFKNLKKEISKFLNL